MRAHNAYSYNITKTHIVFSLNALVISPNSSPTSWIRTCYHRKSSKTSKLVKIFLLIFYHMTWRGSCFPALIPTLGMRTSAMLLNINHETGRPLYYSLRPRDMGRRAAERPQRVGMGDWGMEERWNSNIHGTHQGRCPGTERRREIDLGVFRVSFLLVANHPFQYQSYTPFYTFRCFRF